MKTRRGLTATVSFTVQSVLVGVLVVVPLFAPEALPKQQLTTLFLAPPPPAQGTSAKAATAARPARAKVQKASSQLDDGRLHTPTAVPEKVAMVKDEEAPPPTVAGLADGVVGGVPGGVVGGTLGGVLNNIASAPVAVPKVATPQKLRVSSGVAAGNLIHMVQPQYPPLARQARIQGTVKLQAVIGKDGSIQNLRVVSGHKMLAQAALEAVRQWRYKPYYLNGEPYEVEFEINVEFKLSGG